MTAVISVIDYGVGNLASVKNALDHVGIDNEVCTTPQEIESARAILLPGVGAFGEAMDHLRERNMIDVLTKKVMVEKVPTLGICVGMQLMADSSEEHGQHKGLGWVPGVVRKIDVSSGLRLPHIGWNDLTIHQKAPLFSDAGEDTNYYFVHSYHFDCDDAYIAATTEYGCAITAAIQKDNIFAAQFHPEKSHTNGLHFLRNFAKYVTEQLGGSESVAC